MNEVVVKRFLELVEERGNEVYDLSLQGRHLAILCGLIRFAASELDVDAVPLPARDFITQASEWIEQKFREWGLSPEEIECLKQMPENGDPFPPAGDCGRAVPQD